MGIIKPCATHCSNFRMTLAKSPFEVLPLPLKHWRQGASANRASTGVHGIRIEDCYDDSILEHENYNPSDVDFQKGIPDFKNPQIASKPEKHFDPGSLGECTSSQNVPQNHIIPARMTPRNPLTITTMVPYGMFVVLGWWGVLFRGDGFFCNPCLRRRRRRSAAA